MQPSLQTLLSTYQLLTTLASNMSTKKAAASNIAQHHIQASATRAAAKRPSSCVRVCCKICPQSHEGIIVFSRTHSPCPSQSRHVSIKTLLGNLPSYQTGSHDTGHNQKGYISPKPPSDRYMAGPGDHLRWGSCPATLPFCLLRWKSRHLHPHRATVVRSNTTG